MNANENLKLDNSAMYPITGGPIKNPRKLTLETIVNASPGGTVGFFPAILYKVGTIVATPTPTNMKAIVAGITYGKATAVNNPIEIKQPLIWITFLRPNFKIKPSPKKRPPAMVIINEVYPKITRGPGALITSLK